MQSISCPGSLSSKAVSVSRSKSLGNFWGLCTLHIYPTKPVMVHLSALPPPPLPALSYLNKFLQLHWSSSWKQLYILRLTKPFPAKEVIPPTPAEIPAWDISSPSCSSMAFLPATPTEHLSGCSTIQSAPPRNCDVLLFRCWWAAEAMGLGRARWGLPPKAARHETVEWFPASRAFTGLDESEYRGLASCSSKCREVSLMALFLRNKQLSVTHYHTQVLTSLRCRKTASYKQGKWVIKQLQNDYTIMLCSGTISHKEDGIYPSFKSELLIQNYVCWESLLL